MFRFLILPTLLGYSSIITSTSKLCVLNPMVTQNHPICTPPTFCPRLHRLYKKPTSTTFKELPPLQPGSPSLSHYQSVRDTDEDTVQDETPVYAVEIPCDSDNKYRTIDGSCNNLKHPDWGVADTPMLRLLEPRYRDPNGKVARAKNGGELPLPRVLSRTIFPDADKPSFIYTLALMQFGQLMAHDVGLSPAALPSGQGDCCANVSASVCYPIKIPSNDPFYSQFNQTCMNLIRTRSSEQQFGCARFPDQETSVTHAIDLSEMYGSEDNIAKGLRTFKGGLLLSSKSEDGREFLPLSENAESDCNVPSDQITCFRSGDIRVNQNTQLTCMQVILLREHNRVAKIMSSLNPHWNDEKIFQETRALVIAAYQHIAYGEWMPLVLGMDYCKRYDLLPLEDGYSIYNDSVNFNTINSFMAAAFRVFHSAIQGKLTMMDSARCPFRSINISDWMNRPSIVVEDSNLDKLLIGLTTEAVQKDDRFFTTQMTEMLFHGSLPFGEDLESFDIQRGRDHGIPTYNTMRQLCNRPKAKDFSDLTPDMGKNNVQLLSKAYENVDDVDFFVGGTLETNVPGASIGPTFLCIIGEQFIRKKIGDRFWHEVGGQPHSFSKDQLKEIRKSSLSRLLCDNADNITEIQPNSFRFHTELGNGLVPCSQIPSLNISKWIEIQTNKTTNS